MKRTKAFENDSSCKFHLDAIKCCIYFVLHLKQNRSQDERADRKVRENVTSKNTALITTKNCLLPFYHCVWRDSPSHWEKTAPLCHITRGARNNPSQWWHTMNDFLCTIHFHSDPIKREKVKQTHDETISKIHHFVDIHDSMFTTKPQKTWTWCAKLNLLTCSLKTLAFLHANTLKQGSRQTHLESGNPPLVCLLIYCNWYLHGLKEREAGWYRNMSSYVWVIRIRKSISGNRAMMS